MAWFTTYRERLKERIEEFRLNRLGESINQETFVEKACPMANMQERSLILLIRDIIARTCHIPPELLDPGDKTAELAKLMGGTTLIESLFGGPYGFDLDTFFIDLVNSLRESSISLRHIDKRVVEVVCVRYWDFRTEFGTMADVGSFTSALAHELIEAANAT